MDCSPPGASVLGILQARILEWAATSICRGSSQPRDRIRVSYNCYIGGRVFITSATSLLADGMDEWEMSSIAGLARYMLEGMGYFSECYQKGV